MRDLFKKLTSSLSKTRAGFVDKLVGIVKGHNQIDDALFEELEETLLAGDVGVAATTRILSDLKERVRRNGFQSPEEVSAILKSEMEACLQLDSDGTRDFFEPPERPYVLLIVGVNGTGKTTTIGKLAYQFRQRGRRVLLAAADTFRAAASEQLEIWAQRAGADIVHTQPGADPAAITFDALKAAIARGMDVLIVDTAGRLHTKVNLMEELRKIHRVLSKQLPWAPHEVLLVLDATTGQNGLNQARQFADTVGVSGIVLTKLDGTAKGGIVFAISQELKIPIKFIGVGEGIEDLEPFDAKAFVEALFK